VEIGLAVSGAAPDFASAVGAVATGDWLVALTVSVFLSVVSGVAGACGCLAATPARFAPHFVQKLAVGALCAPQFGHNLNMIFPPKLNPVPFSKTIVT
jgi:hypothetical protein